MEARRVVTYKVPGGIYTLDELEAFMCDTPTIQFTATIEELGTIYEATRVGRKTAREVDALLDLGDAINGAMDLQFNPLQDDANE